MSAVFRIPVSALRSARYDGSSAPRDVLGRGLHDLRISVTDRCNFRCSYCMPKEAFGKDHPFLQRSALLSFEEIARIANVFAKLGVRKIRLTGGEPLLRKHVHKLIEMLAQIPDVEITLTTNGALLARQAADLRAAGLNRLTVSLDAIDDTIFRSMNDVDFPVDDVLHGIDVAHDIGFDRIKLNMVVKRGVNDQQILPMAERFRGSGHIVRFIEYMDVGETNGWRMDDVVSSKTIVETISHRYALEPAERSYTGEVAERWRYADGMGEIGVISSVTQAFCRDCTRMRLSADGRLYTCLFSTSGHDIKTALRDGENDETLTMRIGQIWSNRSDRYSELRSSGMAPSQKIEMSYIGG